MSDRTALQVVLYDCPLERVDEVLDLLQEFGLESDDGEPSAETEPHSVVLGARYSNLEISCGSADEMAARLPGDVIWSLWEDPRYEWLGSLHYNHPDLGEFAAECDAAGRALFTAWEVVQILKISHGDRATVDRLVGGVWEDAFAELRDRNGGVAIPRQQPHQTHSDPGTLQGAVLSNPRGEPTVSQPSAHGACPTTSTAPSR